MSTKVEQDCEMCFENWVKAKRTGVRPDAASIILRCPGCAKKVRLCRLHRPVWVACSDACREVWRKDAQRGLPAEPIHPRANARPRKAKGVEVHQGEMFPGNGRT